MNTKLLPLVVLSLVFTLESKQYCSKTFFSPRQLTYNDVLELALSNYHFYHSALDYEHEVTAGFYVTPFYGQSVNSQDIKRFFFPPHANQLAIEEDGSGTIGSGWIGLDCGPTDPFSSIIDINPKRTVGGAHINLIVPLANWSDGLWGSICFAAVHARHDLNVSEKVLNSCDDRTATQAFNNPEWHFGKLSSNGQSHTGVDDIQLKVGNNWYWHEENHAGLYAMAGIPTGRTNNAEYLFGPVVGSTHASFGLGFNFDIGGWVADEQYLCLMADGHYRYHFSDTEVRSFDLHRNGPWSHYLAVVNSETTDDPKPGINTMSQKVTVRPNSRVQLWTALHYEVFKANIEVGYNYWGRNQETICDLTCNPDKGIWDISTHPQSNATSASKATIDQAAFGPNTAPSDPEFVAIRAADFNVKSAEHPRTSSHTVYAALSYNGEFDNCPSIIGAGVSYELPNNNAALEQWMVWLKLGFVF